LAANQGTHILHITGMRPPSLTQSEGARRTDAV
jgi:hypothetical protein